MNLSDFDYDLPESFIAQTPVEPRDASRLMVLDRATGRAEHRRFRDIGDYLRPGDVLVLNDTRVIPARLQARKARTGGKVELLLLARRRAQTWEALVGGSGVRPGTVLEVDGQPGLQAAVLEDLGEARRLVQFSQPLTPLLERVGHTPLPPYIHQPLANSERYQTVYARQAGSAAAPTAGLHFTPELLLQLKKNGIGLAYVTLHIGLDTFAPVTEARVEEHVIHTEWCQLTAETAKQINEAKLAGGRVVAVGTTAVRVLESAGAPPPKEQEDPGLSPEPTAQGRGEGCPWQAVRAWEGPTSLFIIPGHRFRVVDALITNFHLPRSTLLMLVSAFAGRERMLAAYETAKREGYRFFSFGDAMLIFQAGLDSRFSRFHGSDGVAGRFMPAKVLSWEARAALRNWREARPMKSVDTPRLFISQEGQGLSPRMVQRIIAEMGRLAKVEVSPHTLRHKCAKNLVHKGIALDRVAAILGHSRLETTRIYTTPSRQDQQKAVDAVEEQR